MEIIGVLICVIPLAFWDGLTSNQQAELIMGVGRVWIKEHYYYEAEISWKKDGEFIKVYGKEIKRC